VLFPSYLKSAQAFREQSHYASYTPQQVESTIILLRYLTAKYAIPRDFLPADKRFLATNDVLNFKGIVSHINYRAGGKWDIGPAFDWAGLISGVQASAFTPAHISRDMGVLESAGLSSEEDMAVLFPQESVLADTLEEASDHEGHHPNDIAEPGAAESTPSATGKLYALLMGIDNYDRIRKLGGCVHDIQQVEKYLSERTPFSCDIKTLTDAAATRENLVRQFAQHLGQAQAGDTVLFYYSGHGALEDASPVWDETDKRLECLVCHDGGATKPSDFLFTDKELRHLIAALYEKTGAHIVTIFDCCHSGDNTRGASIAAAFDADNVARRMITDDTRISGAFPQREWSDFLFAGSVKEEDVATKKPGVFLPEGAHIQMAACESDQAAVEVSGEGVFTKKLLAVLDACDSNITYHTLRNRIRQYLRFSFEQTPRIYAAANAEQLLSAGFLNRNVTGMDAVAEATYNNATGWQLNIGAIHGVDLQTRAAIMDTRQAGQTCNAKVTAVFVDHSTIDIDGTPDQTLAHKAIVQGLMTHQLLLELNNYNGNPKDMELLASDLQARGDNYITFGGAGKDSARAADYTLHVRGGEAVITWPADPYRPLVRPLPLVEPADNAALIETLQHISKWHFIRQLQNSQVPDGFPEQPLRIEVTRLYEDQQEEQLDITSGAAILEYEQAGRLWKGAIQINLANTTQQDLYVAALYLDRDFKVFLDFLPQRVQKLEAGGEILLGVKGNDKLTFRLDDVMREYNWPAGVATLKFIVSTDEFNAEALIMGGLPGPYVLADLQRGEQMPVAAAKQLDTGEELPVVFSGWMTQTLGLIFKNPVYNQVDGETLKALMEYEETAYYAAGIYYDVKPDESGAPTLLTLKEGIKLPEAQRGMWTDIKIWAGNKVEAFMRRRLYNRLKKTSRVRMVAEGDSWFQYPLMVQDILDHLYKLYAIRSFADAGDRFENYVTDRDYVAAIEKEKATFFLVSGGGNDILGAQFRNTLRDDPDPGDTTPKRYLNERFFKKLDLLEIWYRDMFAQLKELYPNLHVLTHSYDYIIPTDTSLDSRLASWLGRYMVDKNIGPQQEREALIRYMVDVFNERLEKVVKEFPDFVSYINVRGIVSRDSWFDEIHPTNAGFKLVADRFVAEIERLRTGSKPVQEELETSGRA
jgi:hypothetical protein